MLSCPQMLVSMDWVKLTHIGICEMLLSRMWSLGTYFWCFLMTFSIIVYCIYQT